MQIMIIVVDVVVDVVVAAVVVVVVVVVVVAAVCLLLATFAIIMNIRATYEPRSGHVDPLSRSEAPTPTRAPDDQFRKYSTN